MFCAYIVLSVQQFLFAWAKAIATGLLFLFGKLKAGNPETRKIIPTIFPPEKRALYIVLESLQKGESEG
jgi:hypothetical protein